MSQGHTGLGITTTYPLAFDNGAASVSAGSVAEEILGTVIIPANSLGVNGFLNIETLWTVNNNANAKTVRIRLGSVANLTGTQFLTRDLANNVSAYLQTLISNNHSNAAQIGGTIQGGHGLSTSALPTAAVDSLREMVLVITGQKANGADTLTLAHFDVFLTPAN